jgi:riboflavin kinase/FMN adenylyltransferase
VAIGNFDGVHRGHEHVLRAAAEEARQRGLRPVVLTFYPHPATVLRGRPVPLLTDIDRRCDLIASVDPELTVVVEPFTRQFAETPPEQFAQELLVAQLGARVVSVGHNFRFGSQRSGDLEALKALGQRLGFEATSQELVGDDAGPYSSTRARHALAEGDLESFRRVVGRPHALTGRVVPGDRRGRTLGVPTANLDAVPEAIPAHGVYAARVAALDDDGVEAPLAAAAVNIGVRPTIGTDTPSIEAHLIDFDGDLYGQNLRVHLEAHLRAERRFSSLQELKQQMRADIARAAELAGQPSAWAPAAHVET